MLSMCVVVPYCYFYLYFPDDISDVASFQMLICICVFSLVSYLWPSFCFGCFFLLLGVKSYLYVVNNSPLLLVSFSPQFVAYLLISWYHILRSNKFNFNEVEPINFLSWIMSLMHLKNHYHIQGHVGFFLCFNFRFYI